MNQHDENRFGRWFHDLKVRCSERAERGAFQKYERHLSRIVEKSVEMLREVAEQFPKEKVLLSISGSAGMGLAERSDIQFVQEVYATRIAVNRLVPGTDAVIELGGEDAKILFLRTAITPPP